MPDTAITAKFGMDATPFQRGLAEVRKRLHSIDKATKDLNSTMGKFTQLMGIVGAGALAFRLMASFFASARDRADELEGSMNKNAEAVRNFSRAWEDFKEDGTRIFAGFGVFVIGTLNRIGEKLGETIARMRNVTFGEMSAEQHAMAMEQANRAAARQEELDRLQEESAARLKKQQEELRQQAREMSSEAEAQIKRAAALREREMKLRDDAMLKSLSDAELEEELTRRIAAEEQVRAAITIGLAQTKSRIAQLEKESDNESETERLERIHKLESARVSLAEGQAEIASSRLRTLEMEIALESTLAALEERSAEASRRKREEDEAAAKAKQEQLANLRREAAQARTNLAQAQLNEEEAKADRVAPTIEEAAEKGRGRIKRLAQTALDLEERARDAFLRGNRDKGLELEERARAHREQLSGLIQTADSSPLRSVAQNTAQAAETLEKILEQLKTTEADHAA